MLKCFKFSHGSNAVTFNGKNMLKCFQIRVFDSNFRCTAQMNLLLTVSSPIDCAQEQLRGFWKRFHLIPLAWQSSVAGGLQKEPGRGKRESNTLANHSWFAMATAAPGPQARLGQALQSSDCLLDKAFLGFTC